MQFKEEKYKQQDMNFEGAFGGFDSSLEYEVPYPKRVPTGKLVNFRQGTIDYRCVKAVFSWFQAIHQ